MRILMASFGYPPILNGVTLVAQKVARAMVQKGHEVVVVTASDHGAPYEDQDRGVRLVRVRSSRNPFWQDGPIPFVGRGALDELVASRPLRSPPRTSPTPRYESAASITSSPTVRRRI
jgi:hypothetical protein